MRKSPTKSGVKASTWLCRKVWAWLMLAALATGLSGPALAGGPAKVSKNTPAPAGQMAVLGGQASHANQGRLNLPGNPSQGAVGGKTVPAAPPAKKTSP